MKVPCKNIPTYNHDTDTWSTTSFPNQIEFGKFLLKNCFKEPGQYHFYGIRKGISKVGKFWEKNKYYNELPTHSRDWEDWWDNEEAKCRLGVLWYAGDNIWYVTRDYYFLLNFCPIINKEHYQEETMADFRDGQYHMMLYEKIAEAFHLHSVILKRRQFLFSFCHVAKSLNYYIFENKKTIKWFANDEAFIDDVNGSWKILNSYRNHLQTYTAWDKPSTPDSYPAIQQIEKIRVAGNKWIKDGNESTIVAKTLGKDPKKGVGGPAYFVWYEEGGIAPTADTTKTFMDPALESGVEKVGSFCIGGSVGDLKQCEPLKKFMLDPALYSFFGVPTTWYDETKVEKVCGLFIPAQYGMPEAIDEEGNSDVELALLLLKKAEFDGFKVGEYGRVIEEPAWNSLPEEQYIIKKSQNPKNVKEAFAYRETLFFPTRRIERRQQNINILKESNDYEAPKKGLLEEDKDGNIIFVPISKQENPPIEIEFPVNPKQRDKRGVVTIYKDPPRNPEYLQFFGGLDPIEMGATDTSDSVLALYIFERLTQIEYTEDDQKKYRYEGGKIVASYVGRFNDIEDTNEQAELLIRLYNAFAACERNKPNFINHMRRKGLAVKHMMKRKDLTIFKDLDQTGIRNDEYGVFFGSDGEAELILNDAIKEELEKVIETIHKKDKYGENGEVVKTVRGVDMIPDYWLLEELKSWYPGLNTDRRVAFGLAFLAARTYTLSNGPKKVVERKKVEERKPLPPKCLLPVPKPRNPNIKRQQSLLPQWQVTQKR